MLCRPALLLAVVLATAFVNPLAAQGVRTAASPIIFYGLLVQGGVTTVALYNPNTGETKWVQVGKKYGSYTVGYEPALPATKQTPATKDTVLLTLGGNVQRIQLQDATTTPVATTGAASVQSLEAASFAVLAVLKDLLAQARGDPNADPRLIQELELSIAQQQQKIADDRVWVMSNWSTDYNGHRENAIQTTTADGQHIVIFEDGQQFTVPPGQGFSSVSNSQPEFFPYEPPTRDITSVNGQLILTTEGKQYIMPPDQIYVGWTNDGPFFEPAPAPYTVPPGLVVTGFNRLQQPLFAPIPDDATSYLDHGNAKNARGNFDGAIADYDKALALNPSYAEAYWNRGQARFSKDDFNGALADLDQALALKPNLAGAYGSRGAAKEAKGDLTGALADYDKSIALARGDDAAYPRFFRFLTLRRLHRDAGQADLAGVVAKWQDGWWAKTVGLYLSGALPEQDFLAQSADPNWIVSELQHQCEAYYYVGMTRLIAGDIAKAREFFEKCLATNVTTFFEFTFARAQLARLTGQK